MNKKTLKFKVEDLEKKVAVLEGQVQAHPLITTITITSNSTKTAAKIAAEIRKSLCQQAKKL